MFNPPFRCGQGREIAERSGYGLRQCIACAARKRISVDRSTGVDHAGPLDAPAVRAVTPSTQS